jgi:branched-chain amino acid transport system ATP-binding protein
MAIETVGFDRASLMQNLQGCTLLQLKNIEVVYHRAVTAVQGVSLTVNEGSITAIVGTNGAGKSTTLSAIAGFTRAEDVHVTEGDIHFDGIRLNGLRNYHVSALGVALVPEREKIYPTMTVQENLIACRTSRGQKRVIDLSGVFELFPALHERRNAVAGYVSGGERQMLAISMALLTGPRLLMIDEMSMGLAPIIVGLLLDVLKRLRAEFGITLLFVEQNANTALAIADYIYVMEHGRIVFDGTPTRLSTHPDFQEFYLGMAHAGGEKSYQDVKQYRRKRRWFG